jgi:hypothetical protein
MPRIRSIFPAMTTDEAYMTMTMPTKAAWPALWMQCDDHGVFEWKPIVLKAIIFPADNVDFENVLAELEGLNCVKKIIVEGKAYGLVRNFCRWQRPKEPSYRFTVLPEHRDYLGLNQDGSVPNRNASPKTTPALPQSSGSTVEKFAQREEIKGGDKRRRKSSITPSTQSSVVVLATQGKNTTTTTQPVDDCPKKVSRLGTALPKTWVPDDACIEVANDHGMTEDVIAGEVLRFHAHNAQRGTFSHNWNETWTLWCAEWKRRADMEASKVAPRIEVSGSFKPMPKQWHDAARIWATEQRWSRQFGPEPGMGACRCPPDILIAHGINPDTGYKARPAVASIVSGVK